jgi:hypothetical protein
MPQVASWDITRLGFKTLAFLVHFGFSIFLLQWYIQNSSCNSGNRSKTYTQTFINLFGKERESWAVLPNTDKDQSYHYTQDYVPVMSKVAISTHCPEYNVSNGITENDLCIFRGVMPSMETTYLKDDYTLGSTTNLVFLMILFEWITASFALDYVAESLYKEYKWETIGKMAHQISIVWNVILLIVVIVYIPNLPWNNVIIVGVISIVAITRQMLTYGQYMNKTVTRYIEYALTAPVLMISVLSIVASASQGLYCIPIPICLNLFVMI